MSEENRGITRLLAPENGLRADDGTLLQEFDERFLLTPPANDNPKGDPFDNVQTFRLPSPSHLSLLLEQNARAFRQNATPAPGAGNGALARAGTVHGAKPLHLKTDVTDLRRTSSVSSAESFNSSQLRSSVSAGNLPLRVPSVRHRLHSSAGSVSPGSVISSPQIAAMLDITPLPSPIMGPNELQAFAGSRSRASSTSSNFVLPQPVVAQSPPRKKGYGSLQGHRKSSLSGSTTPADHDRSRSVSDYVPEPILAPKLRKIVVSGGLPSPEAVRPKASLHREDYLGEKRGIAQPVTGAVPVADPSTIFRNIADQDEPAPKRPKTEIYCAESIHTGATKHYESIRILGQGTFSKVYLAVRMINDRKDSVDYRQESTDLAGVRARSRRLVAVKVVEPGPAGGADAERIEVSLKREVELMRKILHPSIIHLKSFGKDPDGKALLVMNYCPGGDLFEVASNQLSILTPSLVRRIFSELVSAVRFLHQKYIVHRDIKLENVLLNIPAQVHQHVDNWQTIDRAVVTLTDLGLSRTIPQPPESPLLETRCGSEDYAAPEILMGQPYDGRATDAWALGVLLYSLMEGRLPFDPVPGARGDPAILRARTPHRIARCEWQWVRYGDEDGEWDVTKGADLEGGRDCVNALLKRNTRRKPLSDIREWPWVKDGIQVDGGLRWVEEENM